jgi:hypothetical protein
MFDAAASHIVLNANIAHTDALLPQRDTLADD